MSENTTFSLFDGCDPFPLAENEPFDILSKLLDDTSGNMDISLPDLIDLTLPELDLSDIDLNFTNPDPAIAMDTDCQREPEHMDETPQENVSTFSILLIY